MRFILIDGHCVIKLYFISRCFLLCSARVEVQYYNDPVKWG